MSLYPLDDLERILPWCTDAWEKLRGARVLVTGGTGFFGRWLVGALVHANARLCLGLRVAVVARHQPLEFFPDVEVVTSDVRSLDIDDPRFTHIVHLATAASARFNREHPVDMISTIVDGTRRVLDIAARSGAHRMLFVSSGAVYGTQPADLSRVPEDYLGGPDPLHPASAYGEAKRLAEQLCVAHARENTITIPIARCWAFVGPGLPLDAHFAAGNFIGDVLAGRPVAVQSDGTAVRSYLYAADLAAWLVRILVCGAPARAYNVGSDQAVSMDVLAAITAFTDPAAPLGVTIRDRPTPGAVANRYVPSIARAQNELGLHVWTPLRDAIRKTIEWHRGRS